MRREFNSVLAVANHDPNSPNTVCGTAALPGASGTNGHLCATGWWPWMVAVPESTVLTLDPDSKDALDAESGIHRMDRWTHSPSRPCQAGLGGHTAPTGTCCSSWTRILLNKQTGAIPPDLRTLPLHSHDLLQIYSSALAS